uniref:RNA-directed DNA polymerase, eukaryota, reverse transcriptase zinc-binding domain protein n=1 Tax=Tanacetum cinerariifolium TaxID=118510 RepID=A0A6L2LVC5_TANCI|nr:RNA-directed DNA polymerase, eukaryota, reverse transcriptase zinc-binding domain protein [Tanacetum cinerariifolium]
MESMDLVQKARVKWEVEGDENSKFFHDLTKSRRKSQMDHGIMHEGAWISEPKDIKEDLLKHDIQEFVVNLFSTGTFSQGSNYFFITLIPKGGHEDTKKFSWFKWENILASLDKGGLSVGSLKAFNKALLLKWRWRLFQNLNALWVHVVKAIHGDAACVDLRGCQTNGVWASIVGMINHLHSSGIVSLNSIHFKVGNDSSIRFWKDTWPITMGRTKTEFDKLILDIASLKSDEIVDSDSCIWSLSHDDTFLVNKVGKHINERSFPMLSPSTRLDLDSISCMVCNGLLNQMRILCSLVTWLLLFGVLLDLGLAFRSQSFACVKTGTFGLIRDTLLRTSSLVRDHLRGYLLDPLAL